ncbi:MAG: hypothetical protein JXQ72_11610 [Anaerolineae bacterium]|nr:hypothetical protein [Anaerolineae bacterium]
MSSWALFRAFFPWNDSLIKNMPVFARDRTLAQVWQRISAVLDRFPVTLIVLSSIGTFLAVRIIDPPYARFCLDGLLLLIGPPVLLLPSLVLWVLPLGFALAPIIARERHHRLWEMLRVTPYTTEELVIGKARGALWELRGLFTRLGELQVQVIAAILLGLGFMQFLSLVQEWPGDLSPTGRSALCVGVLLMLLVLLGVFFLDRIQQLTLMITAALAASTSATATHTGLTRTITATFVAWSLDAGVAVVVLLVQPGGHVQDIKFSVAAVVMLGPIAGYVIDLPPLTIACLITATLAAREVTIRVLWRLALHNAERSG